jgi:tRNA-dihydrouridine synthase 3
MAQSHETTVGNETAELLNGVNAEPDLGNGETAAEKRKLAHEPGTRDREGRDEKRRKGTAPIREEYLVHVGKNEDIASRPQQDAVDDDAAEAFHHKDRAPGSNNSRRRQKNQGQNTGRKFGKSRDEVNLCSSRMHSSEFSPVECKFGKGCRYDHDLRKYLREHKREDLTTFDGICPVWDVKGYCSAGWKCRFVGSHSKEVEHEDGRRELILVEDEEKKSQHQPSTGEEIGTGVVNSISPEDRISLSKRKFPTTKSDIYLKWLDSVPTKPEKPNQRGNSSSPEPINTNGDNILCKEDNRSHYKEPPFLPSEKRRLYFDASTPILAPLTTQGNLPFRRLCTTLGATFTYSEMAMSLPLLQGHKPEWALIKAHESELQPPTFTTKSTIHNIQINHPTYNPATDTRFSAQIAANKPWIATKATEVLTALLPPSSLRCIDLNVGCPIDLVYREGAGSALMDSPAKLEKILHGMNAVSGTTPITCKIRMGTRDNKPTAQKLVERLVLGGGEETSTAASLGGATSGVAAIALHGRSRQQRYTRSADWGYIAETAALIKRINSQSDNTADTVHDPDPRTLPPGGKVFFLGNGDCYTHTSYHAHIRDTGVDSVMIARGALQKPWIFEEIVAGQMLDKSSSERLGYVERFCRFGLEAWGSDEWGVGTTRRFLLEWLSFACRYVPVGLLERRPIGEGRAGQDGWVEPSIQDRAPAYRGRDELETLMASEDYKDWIKIRYVVFLCSLWYPHWG